MDYAFGELRYAYMNLIESLHPAFVYMQGVVFMVQGNCKRSTFVNCGGFATYSGFIADWTL